MSEKVLTESELCELAHECAGDMGWFLEQGDAAENAEQALKVLAGDQSYVDDIEGSVTDWPFVHVTRIANWILIEDEQGFSDAQEYGSCEQANAALEDQRKLWHQEELQRPRGADELQEGDYVRAFKHGQFIGAGRVFYEGEPGVIRVARSFYEDGNRVGELQLRIERGDHDWHFQMAEPEEANG